MDSEQPIKEPEPVSCEICHREIPNADSFSIEGQEYIYYFCGHGCYSRWHEQKLGREESRAQHGASKGDNAGQHS